MEKWPESYDDQRLEPARFWKVPEVTAHMSTPASEFFPEDREREPQNLRGRKTAEVQIGFPKWPRGRPAPDRSPKDKEGTRCLKGGGVGLKRKQRRREKVSRTDKRMAFPRETKPTHWPASQDGAVGAGSSLLISLPNVLFSPITS